MKTLLLLSCLALAPSALSAQAAAPSAVEPPDFALSRGPAALVPADPQAEPYFGWDVALDGDWAAVASLGTGVVYVYRYDGQAWTEHARLTVPDGVADNGFGGSVALSGERLVVGAYADGGTGAAYVFQRYGGAWVHVAKLRGHDLDAGDFFGLEVAIDGDRIVIGALKGDDFLTGEEIGTIYAFETDGRTWTETDKLWPPGGGYGGDGFSYSIDIDGDVMVVGAPYFKVSGSDWGRAYAYERVGDQWVLKQELDAVANFGQLYVGTSVAVDGDLIAIGASGDGPGTNFEGHGAVYLFRRGPTAWELEAKLARGAELYTTEGFGGHVALRGNRLAVSASGGPLAAVIHFEKTRLGWTAVEEWNSDAEETIGYVRALGDGFALLPTTTAAGGTVLEARPFGPRPDLLNAPEHLTFNHEATRQELFYDGGLEHAGALYAVLGSFSGTGPTVVDGVEIPLAFDAYTLLTITDPGGTDLQGPTGVLDARGRGTAAFVIPPGGLDFAFAGLTFQHAFVLLDPTGQTVVHASSPASVGFVY